MTELDDWLKSLNSAEDVAEEAYTSLRNSWPGDKPKWLRQPWHLLPQAFRGLLVTIAERASLPADQPSTR